MMRAFLRPNDGPMSIDTVLATKNSAKMQNFIFDIGKIQFLNWNCWRIYNNSSLDLIGYKCFSVKISTAAVGLIETVYNCILINIFIVMKSSVWLINQMRKKFSWYMKYFYFKFKIIFFSDKRKLWSIHYLGNGSFLVSSNESVLW